MVKVADGKYEVLHENGTSLRALRYGEPWRDLCGDGLVLALVQRIEELEEALRRIRDHQGDEKLPVRNSVAKSGIARAALDGPCGCACEPSGSDGLRCPDAEGRLLCETKKADPTGGLGLARFQAQFDDGDEE